MQGGRVDEMNRVGEQAVKISRFALLAQSGKTYSIRHFSLSVCLSLGGRGGGGGGREELPLLAHACCHKMDS